MWMRLRKIQVDRENGREIKMTKRERWQMAMQVEGRMVVAAMLA